MVGSRCYCIEMHFSGGIRISPICNIWDRFLTSYCYRLSIFPLRGDSNIYSICNG